MKKVIILIFIVMMIITSCSNKKDRNDHLNETTTMHITDESIDSIHNENFDKNDAYFNFVVNVVDDDFQVTQISDYDDFLSNEVKIYSSLQNFIDTQTPSFIQSDKVKISCAFNRNYNSVVASFKVDYMNKTVDEFIHTDMYKEITEYGLSLLDNINEPYIQNKELNIIYYSPKTSGDEYRMEIALMLLNYDGVHGEAYYGNTGESSLSDFLENFKINHNLSSGTSNLDTNKFFDIANGIWVDLTSCSSLDKDMSSFLFVGIENSYIYSGYTYSEMGPTGEITSVSVFEHFNYLLTVYYPESDYFGEHYEEQYVDITIRIIDGKLYFGTDDFNSPYTYMGKNLEEAEQAVCEYLKDTIN